MKRWLATQLRRLVWWLDGEETDNELRARCLGLVRRHPPIGSREDLEAAIRGVTPMSLEPEFIWDSPLSKGDRLKLTVIWR